MNNNGSRNKVVSLDEVCTLIEETYLRDEIGQDIPQETKREVFCAEIPVYASEYHQNMLRGIKPSIALVISREEYNKETLLEYKGQRYAVYRLYFRDNEWIELYCEVKAGVK